MTKQWSQSKKIFVCNIDTWTLVDDSLILVNDHIIDYVNSRKSSCVNFTGLYAYIYSLLCNSRSTLQRKCSFVLLIFTQVHFCMICGRFNTSIIYYSRQGDQKWNNPPFIVQQLLDSHISVFTIRDVNIFWSSRRKLKSSRQYFSYNSLDH